ncbi:type VII secretion protein EccCb [Corynebacterium flavescens]|uniref:type VII secretion protein EccCb n=1 Tax=Corynebacterium flavescens TaxID=28028 RepID=UPI00264950BB|nr:type VII secretion protein EccCb [Corynebacterium flavescens]MDN6199292.1 type VII secretion protein EccCb [Corynebacterium flavescens]MDN6226041.1 type VII secretion protein EccCb [Corynebacterium flavescens]
MLELEDPHVVDPLSRTTRDPAPPLPSSPVEAEPVPEAQRPQPVALIRLLMPLIMVVAMVGMVALLVLSSGEDRQISPMALMFPVMMLASMFMMFNPQSSGEDPNETRRTYLRHLKALREKALDNAAAQRAHEEHRHPATSTLPALIGTRRMWERAPDDADSLEVRVGSGETALVTPIKIPDSGAAEDLDPVCAVSVRQTVRAVSTVTQVPVVLQLRAFRFISLTGARSRDLARAMVLQLVTFHGPETLGIEAIGPGWEWLKWLPHTREPGRARFRLILVEDAASAHSSGILDDPDLTTIIGVDPPVASEFSFRAEDEGICLIADESLSVSTAAGVEDLGCAEEASMGLALLVARAMARFRRPLSATRERGRHGNDLLGLLGYEASEDIHRGDMWRGVQGQSRLRVPIGLDDVGQPVYLDLKESAQGGMGPHGLCVGATGSGKSELLRSLVAALAASHSPEELNFVLVDFKGGATFLGCDVLPHTAAVITNLESEATLVERMQDAISGEMNRRQEFLRAAGNFANVGDYNAARGGAEPMAALVIVIDEFSELLGQHPDFADLFGAVGRLGRSLHIHLLLASQRLEEGRLRGLESHLSYRIGLRTFSAAESRQVLGVPDAYHLPAQPGIGYLKSDAEELTRVQACYVSGPVTRRALPQAPLAQPKGLRVEFFHAWTQSNAGESPRVEIDHSTTVLAAVVSAARNEAATKNLNAHRIWLPPLPHVVELSTAVSPLLATGSVPALNAVVGIIDRPYYQRQDPLLIDLSGEGGHLAVCGGPQSGKSTFLNTVVSALCARHSPEEVRLYVIDCANRLSTLSRLPQVAAVAGKGEAEKTRRIVDEVSGLIRRPEERETFLVIDGWHHFGTAGADFEDLGEVITSMAADGPSARVHLVISTARWTAMRPAIRDLIANRVELRLAEAMDSLIDRKAQQKIPKIPGRGITSAGEHMLIAKTSNQDIAHVAHLHANVPAVPALKMLPTHLSEAPASALGSIAWGIGGPDLEAMVWDPQSCAHLVCVGSSGSGKSTFLATIMQGLSGLDRAVARLVVIDERRAHLGDLDPEMVAAYAATSESAREAIAETVHTLKTRLPGPDVTPQQLIDRSWWEGPDIYVVIDDLDLVSEATLSPLIEVLAHARDVGLHLVIARKSGGIGRALFGGFLTAVRDLQPAVLLFSADRDEGSIFGMKPSTQIPGRGTWSVRGEVLGLVHVSAPLMKGTA